MRYQITELEFLNLIYADFRLVKQMMIWSYFAHNKFDTGTKYYIIPQYQYAVPLQKNQDKLSPGNIDFEKTLTSVNSYSVTQKSKVSSNQLRHKKTYLIHLADSVYAFHLHLDKNIENGQWNFKIQNTTGNSPDFEIDSAKMVISGKEKFDRLQISYLNKKEKKLNIKDLQVYDRYQFVTPRFGFYLLKNIPQLEADSLYQIQCIGDYLNETVVFYRFAPDLPALKTAKYEINNTVSLAHPYFIPKQTGYYQFFLSTPMIKGYWISNPEIRKVEMASAD
jgi:hypothetical protein